jgi:hypothetical protein
MSSDTTVAVASFPKADGSKEYRVQYCQRFNSSSLALNKRQGEINERIQNNYG